MIIVLYFWNRKCHLRDLTLLNQQKIIPRFQNSGYRVRIYVQIHESKVKNIQSHLILSNFEPVITGRRINGDSTEVLTFKIKLAVITMVTNWTRRTSTVKSRRRKYSRKVFVNPYVAGIIFLEDECSKWGNEYMGSNLSL